jgi:hypothetical protein
MQSAASDFAAQLVASALLRVAVALDDPDAQAIGRQTATGLLRTR